MTVTTGAEIAEQRRQPSSERYGLLESDAAADLVSLLVAYLKACAQVVPVPW